MNHDEAIKLIRALVVAEIEVVKAYNNGRGVSKTKLNNEKKAASRLFEALTASKPDAEQVLRMTDY